MKRIETDLPGCVVMEPAVFGDSRGFFYEGWNKARFAEAGIHAEFVQHNVSSSTHGVLRGLHYQWPNPQGKLVSVLEGKSTMSRSTSGAARRTSDAGLP